MQELSMANHFSTLPSALRTSDWLSAGQYTTHSCFRGTLFHCDTLPRCTANWSIGRIERWHTVNMTKILPTCWIEWKQCLDKLTNRSYICRLLLSPHHVATFIVKLYRSVISDYLPLNAVLITWPRVFLIRAINQFGCLVHCHVHPC